MFTLNCGGRLLNADRPLVMGIINTTPDSFYEGSRQRAIDAVLRKAEQMMNEGAAILDLGGQSSRPGAEAVKEDEELQRVIAPIAAIRQRIPEAVISIDTYYARVAEFAVSAGATIINDISGGTLDEIMLATAGRLAVPYVCTHIKGQPKNMQQQAVYEDITREILEYFIERIETCRRNGIKDIIIDPGFGFAKTIAQNFKLLKNLAAFNITGKPVLVGLSRKKTVYQTLQVGPEDALNGSTVMHTIALQNGASILRVHDVKEAVQAITLTEAYRQA